MKATTAAPKIVSMRISLAARVPTSASTDLDASTIRARCLLVREDDLGGVGWGHIGVDREDGADAADEPRDDVRRD